MLEQPIIVLHAEVYETPNEPSEGSADFRSAMMKILIRLAFTALSLTFGIAHAAPVSGHGPIQQGNSYNYLQGGD